MRAHSSSNPLIRPFALLLAVCALPAAAEMDCKSSGEAPTCEGAASVLQLQRYGDTTYASRSDGSYAVMHRNGDVSVVSDSRPGMSGTMTHYGDTAIYSHSLGSSVCTTFGEAMWCT